jgi:hypothetical protein
VYAAVFEPIPWYSENTTRCSCGVWRTSVMQRAGCGGVAAAGETAPTDAMMNG